MLHKLLNDEQMDAYEAGKDSVINGANTENCNFRIFSTPEKTKAWERGVADAKAMQKAKD